MSIEIKKDITQSFTIQVSEYDNKRCSRNCNYCHKSSGLYQCFLRYKDGEEIELLDDVDDGRYETADTYGFQRTNFCLEKFNNEV